MAQLVKKQLLFLKSIKNSGLLNVMVDFKKPIGEIILKQAIKNRLLVPRERRKKAKKNFSLEVAKPQVRHALLFGLTATNT